MSPSTSQPLPTRIALALLWAFVFTLPLTQMTEFPMLATISRIAGVLALASGVIAVAARKHVRLPGAVHVAMAGFIVWSAVTLFWSVAPELTAQRTTTYLQLFILVLLIWELCLEERDVLRIASSFVLGTMIPALSTLRAFLPGEQILYRRAAAGTDFNHLAFVLALSLPVAYYLSLRNKGATSVLYRLQMSVAVCAILMSGSAATMIAMAVGLSLVFWTFHVIPVRTRMNAFALVMLLIAAALVFIPSSATNFLAQESRTGGIALTETMDSGIASLHNTPLGAFGAATGARLTGAKQFTMFAETGVIGVAWFVVMMSVLFVSAERLSGPTKSFWFTVLAVWAVGACTLDWESVQPAWLLFGLLTAHSASLRQTGATEKERRQKRNYYIEQEAEVWS
jgi:hypothetical protein